MSGVTLTILIVIVVLIIAAVALVVHRQAQQRRTERLKEKFGPEYDRSLERADDPRQAEAQLREREKRHSDLDLRELDEGQRRQFEQRWSDVQRRFVDDPSDAVNRADGLVTDVMKARGYPVADFDHRAEDLSVRYPVVTQNYREARAVAQANKDGRADTEQLRGAVTSYRTLVDALLTDRDERHDATRHDSRGDQAGSDGADTDRNRDARTEQPGPDNDFPEQRRNEDREARA